jgi:hypothetical protein
MDPSKFVSISNIFRNLSEGYQDPGGDPIRTGAALVGMNTLNAPSMVNVCIAFVLWWRAKERTIWRVKPDTAAYLRGVGLHFIPEATPSSWSGNAVVIESTDKQVHLFGDVFSLAGYRVRATRGDERYYLVMLTTPEGSAYVTSVKADLGRVDDGAEIKDMPFFALSGEPLDSEEMHRRTIETARFAFAFSLYALSPERVSIQDQGGPMARGPKGRAVKRDGRAVYLWRYRDLSIIRRQEPGEPKGPLDNSDISLQPVIVSPHIRWHRGRAVIIDAYGSHRWKRSEGFLGDKRKV